MIFKRSRIQYQRQVKVNEEGQANRRVSQKKIDGEVNQLVVQGMIERMQQIAKRYFCIKYILLMLFFIVYGSILVSLKQQGNFQISQISYQNTDFQQQHLISPQLIISSNLSSPSLQLFSIDQQNLTIDNYSKQQQSFNELQDHLDSKFPIAISRTEQSIVRDIISTYQDNYKKITRVEQQLPSKNAQVIDSIKKQTNNRKKYNDFSDIIEQASGNGRTVLFYLQLFPFLRSWATTPRPTTKLQKFANIFKGIFVSETYLWDDLYEMLDRGGYWQSNGNLLTVATYSKVIDDQFGSLQIFTPTIIRLWLPYDISTDQIITFTGIRMRYDLHSKVETRWISQYLGELRVKVSQQERKRRQPIERVFYCEQQGCNYLYSLVQLKSNHNIRLHFLSIESIFSVGR